MLGEQPRAGPAGERVRVVTSHGSPEDLERWVSTASQAVKPRVAQQQGIVTAFWLVDRAESKGLTITIWASEEAMRKSEQFANRARPRHQMRLGRP